MKSITSIKIILLSVVILLNTACSEGGGSGNTASNQSNSEFVAKVEAVTSHQIRLYPGHLNAADLVGQLELDGSNLDSGDLITINIEFEVTGDITDYSLSAQLVPQSVYSKFNQGTTIGEIFSNADGAEDQEFYDLGVSYISAVTPGLMHATIHAKLPVLQNTEMFKVIVSPSIDYLSAGNFNDADIEKMPMLVDSTELTVNKLAEVKASLTKTPDIILDNDFTELEEGQAFDINNYAVEPIFQTSVNVDISSFNSQEVVVTKLFWRDPAVNQYHPVALMSENAQGEPIVNEEARFTVKIPTQGKSTMLIPVSAHILAGSQDRMMALSTNIREIADTPPLDAHFILNVATLDSTTGVVSAGTSYNMFIPLVSQSVRAVVKPPEEVVKYTVLRADATINSCIGHPFDPIDNVRNTVNISASNCDTALTDEYSLWRYDIKTKQIILKYEKPLKTEFRELEKVPVVTESESYCLTAVPSGTTYSVYETRPCTNTGTWTDIPQKFDFKDDGTIRMAYADLHLIFSGTNSATLTSDPLLATTFFTDANGIDVDSKGRVFSSGKNYVKQWGDAGIAQVQLDFGGDAFVDYVPVIGAEAKGHGVLTASMLGHSKDLFNARFRASRYFDKKISLTTNNYPNKTVGDGVELIIDVLGDRRVDLGGIETKIVDQSVNVALDSAVNLLSNVSQNIPLVNKIKPGAADLTFKMDNNFLVTSYPVVCVVVTIEGGVRGSFVMSADLGITNDPGIVGISVSATEALAISAYLNATADALIVSGQVSANLELVTQNVTFTTTHGFTADGILSLNYYMDASLVAALKVIKGNIAGFVEYTVPRWGVPPWKKKRHDFTIFETDYLYNKTWDIFKLKVPECVAGDPGCVKLLL